MLLRPCGLNAQSNPVVFESADRQVALLELFTSEGCSSCPPAETWLSGLKHSPRLWKEFVPLAFHVDYWDYLGWRDPWASKDFSDRQRAYAESWRSDSVYTPGFVLNGKEWRDWSRSKDGPRSSGAKVGVLKISSGDLKHWQVSFSPGIQRQSEYEVHAALLANGLTSDVKAGENRGRRLNHDFVVTALAKSSLKMEDNDLLRVSSFWRKPAKGQPERTAIAAWVTRVGRLEPVQAVGGWLPERGAKLNRLCHRPLAFGPCGAMIPCKDSCASSDQHPYEKTWITILFLLSLAMPCLRQTKSLLNLDKNGLAVQGYDPVAFFTENKPVKGRMEFRSVHRGATYYFASAEDKARFDKEPAKYEPAYGGFCAYGVSRNKLVEIDPEAFQIVDGRLLLQYSKGVRNDFNKDTQGNLSKANANWPALVGKERQIACKVRLGLATNPQHA